MNKKINQLDIFRIVSAMMVFTFHCSIHLGASFSFLTPFVQEGAIFMVAFFCLSGFVLYLTYYDKNVDTNESLIGFYKKRILSIYPLYLFTYIIILLFKNTEPMVKTILIAPFELLLMQTFFDGSFPISGNGGTWFVSCIFICYLLFPFLKKFLYQSSISSKYILIASTLLAAIAPVCVWMFDFSSIYTSPFFRLLEFFCGMTMASIYLRYKKRKLPYTIFALLESLVLVLLISILHIKGLGNYTLTTFITLPLFLSIIFHMSCSENKVLLNISSNRIVSYLSKISYSFFLSQLFTWDISKKILEYCTFFKNRNLNIIFISLLVCLILTIILYEVIEKKIVKGVIIKYISPDKSKVI